MLGILSVILFTSGILILSDVQAISVFNDEQHKVHEYPGYWITIPLETSCNYNDHNKFVFEYTDGFDNKLEILIHEQSRIVSEEKKELSLMKKMDDLDRQIDEDLLASKQPPKKKEVISEEGVVADS